jgi:hypothetical protein
VIPVAGEERVPERTRFGPVPVKITVKVITVKATVKITVEGSKIAG